MDVLILANKACPHRQSLGRELEHLHIPYHLCFAEDHADLVERFTIRHSPTLIVDDELAFRGQPTGAELHAFFGTRASLRPGPSLALEVNITADLASVDVMHHGRAITIMRNQDPANVVTPDFATTSRKCPPFCIQPGEVAPGVTTIAELEMLHVLQQVSAGDTSCVVIDSRTPDWVEKGSIPGSVNIPWDTLDIAKSDSAFVQDILERQLNVQRQDGVWTFGGAKTLVLFCKGIVKTRLPSAEAFLVSRRHAGLGMPRADHCPAGERVVLNSGAGACVERVPGRDTCLRSCATRPTAAGARDGGPQLGWEKAMTSTSTALPITDIGVIGLGVMGKNLRWGARGRWSWVPGGQSAAASRRRPLAATPVRTNDVESTLARGALTICRQ
ncbi:MAG: rhodanese-like domain-containing protein [Gemmatimonadota bacterium]|nr:rhodanese-like domain-containing protein [Gemmatimonadota bacterium]